MVGGASILPQKDGTWGTQKRVGEGSVEVKRADLKGAEVGRCGRWPTLPGVWYRCFLTRNRASMSRVPDVFRVVWCYCIVPLSHHDPRSAPPKSTLQHRPQDVQRSPVAPPPRSYSLTASRTILVADPCFGPAEEQLVHRQAPCGGPDSLQGARTFMRFVCLVR